MIKAQMRASTFILACLLGVSRGEEDAKEPDVEFKRVSVTGQFDNGQIVSGLTNHYDNPPTDIVMDGDFFQRTSAWITQEAIVDKRLRLTMGVGGVFWYALPANVNSSSRLTQFGPGISQAQAVYTFGDVEKPVTSLQMGFFPYKYNSDAKNLGEYLMRSGTYPGFVVTGGWNMLSSAAYMVQGLRLNVSLADGAFNSDLLLAMEHDLPPLYGITPAYIATYKPVPGVQIGAGAACNHCLPIKPSRESPHIPENQVITGVKYDTVSQAYTFTRDTNSFYSFQGVKVTGSLSLDPKSLISMDILGPEDLKIYGEVAILGVKNYPYLYDKIAERMPIMVGFNIPTFKLLEVFSFELEHYNSKFVNNYKNLVYGSSPTWYIPGADGSPVTPDEVARNLADTKSDDWKWSLYAKKELTKGIRIYAQAASDHIRTIQVNGGPMPTMVPITNRNGKDWYYIVRLEFGI
jgi:hypothetical protein